MFIDERQEPHFHIWRAGIEYRFRLRDFEQMPDDYAKAPMRLRREMREWAERNRLALESAHASLLAGRAPDKDLFRG